MQMTFARLVNSFMAAWRAPAAQPVSANRMASAAAMWLMLLALSTGMAGIGRRTGNRLARSQCLPRTAHRAGAGRTGTQLLAGIEIETQLEGYKDLLAHCR